MRYVADICVLGGGPAGSAIAGRLSYLGHKVCLVEREVFPRAHVGEALSPGILPLLDVLGVRQKVESAGFLRPRRTIVRWTGTPEQRHFDNGAPGFIVDRGRFDHLLLDSATGAGVRVLQPGCALRPVHEGHQRWVIPVKHANGVDLIQAKVVVDATGKGSVLRRRRRRVSVPTVALCGQWRNTRLAGADTWVEAGPDEWFWGALLPDGSLSAMVFTDTVRRAPGENDLVPLYRSLLNKSLLLRNSLSGTLERQVRACDASSYVQDSPIEEDLIQVGEAAFSIDPMASQGVQAALRSALQGALAMHTILSVPENTAAAKQFYRERQLESVSFHYTIATQHYRRQGTYSDRLFWRKRATELPTPPSKTERSLCAAEPMSPRDKMRLSAAAAFAPVPVALGDLIVEMSALFHPALQRPVAFLNGIELRPLLRVFEEQRSVDETLTIWRRHLDLQTAYAILRWLRERSIILKDRESG
jgi:flavin-dependent dehydrogenase